MGHDVCDFVAGCLRTGEVPKWCALVLIPKVESPDSMAQFRPISLCSTLYKIIVNRLKILLPYFESQNQSSFVPGRQIADNVVIFQALNASEERKGRTYGYQNRS